MNGERKLIDTLQFSVLLEAEHIYNFHMRYGGQRFNDVLNNLGMHGIVITLYKKCKPIRLSFFVDCKFILKKQKIEERDYKELEKYLLKALDLLFEDDSLYISHTLTRIDYSFDIEFHDKNESEILLDILKKQTESYRRIKIGKIYESGIGFETESDSIEIAIYDKTIQRASDGNISILRFEVRLKNDHLYNFSKRKRIKKQIKDFFKKDYFVKYMEEYLFKIIFKGDYYSANAAKYKIDSTSLKKLDKEKVFNLAEQIEVLGIENVKMSMNPKTFRKRINMLNENGLNPFCIPAENKKDFILGVYTRFRMEYNNYYSNGIIDI